MSHMCDIWLNASLFLQECDVDSQESPALVPSTVQYIYNDIHSKAQAKVS